MSGGDLLRELSFRTSIGYPVKKSARGVRVSS
jgi:hypothetical protein